MIHELWIIFGWPNGIVIGNLMASAIVGAIGFVHLDRLARKHHREHMDKTGDKDHAV